MKSTITCDMEGVIRSYNRGAEEVFGYAAAEVVGLKRVSLFSPGLVVLQNVEAWLRTAREKKVYEGETVFVRKDGSEFPAHIRITPTYQDGVQTGYCGVTEPLDRPVAVRISAMTRALAWLVVMRAPFLSASIMPVLIGGAFAAAAAPQADFPGGHFALALIGVALLHLASNVFNDYFDWKSGTDQANASYFLKYSGGSRGIELGLVTVGQTLQLAVGLLGVSTLIGIYLTAAVGWGVLVFGLAGACAGYFYTAPPIRLVARRGLGELFIGLAFGPLITAGVVYTVTGSTELLWSSLLLGAPVGLLTANILVINQVPDAEADASTGKNHLVVTLGKENTPLLYGGIWGLALVLHAVLALSLPAATLWWWIPWAAALIHGVSILAYMRRHIGDRSLVRANVQTILLNLHYGLLTTGAILIS
ncbi:MAG: UbiA family prenyltransferase [Bacteroidota bacterium]